MLNEWKLGDKCMHGNEECVVVGICLPEVYINSQSYQGNNFDAWNSADIFWRENNLLSLKYKYPLPIMTVEEFGKYSPYKDCSPDELIILHKYLVQRLQYLTVPQAVVRPI